ncbi:MAG: hypothetical protein A2Y96_01995 [Firmicutes bacterium RBG_13_65_8]|nr:MAG: hypothetical protein A2Y96_01995 [Firmicutes bacterium RBG_13_65_8]
MPADVRAHQEQPARRREGTAERCRVDSTRGLEERRAVLQFPGEFVQRSGIEHRPALRPLRQLAPAGLTSAGLVPVRRHLGIPKAARGPLR